MKVKPTKDKVKDKVKAVKGKVKDKLKGKRRAAAAALLLCAALCGCMETQPASRATTASYRIDVAVKVDDGARGNTFNLPFTIGDGALASADSAGSTETQTATPTLDIRTKVDARYNDALAAASAASRGVLETLTAASANAVLKLMDSKETGAVDVVKADGTTATVKCEDGQCSFCTETARPVE